MREPTILRNWQLRLNDDWAKIHWHKQTKGIYREYVGRYYGGAKRPVEENTLGKQFQLELIGTESVAGLDARLCPWDGIGSYRFDDVAELGKSFHAPVKIDAVNGRYIMDALEKQRLERKQIELYAGAV
jgi:hypothetical protein